MIYLYIHLVWFFAFLVFSIAEYNINKDVAKSALISWFIWPILSILVYAYILFKS